MVVEYMPTGALTIAIAVLVYTVICLLCGMMLVTLLVATKEKFSC